MSFDGTLGSVEVSRDVLQTCLAHALTTEREEIMGMLLGDIEQDESGGSVARVWRLSFQRRVDRRPDRVEISPEQLAAASDEAARMTEETRRVTRVIGWYHSHPHITVLPSHVDVQTQGNFQLLERGFIGLIFSVFSSLPDSTSRMQMVAFQSVSAPSAGGGQPVFSQRLVPVSVVETPATGDRAPTKLLDLQRVQLDEEREAYLDALATLTRDEAAADPGSHAVELGVSFHSAVYQKVLCGILAHSLPPLAQTLHDRKQLCAREIAALEAELAEYELTEAEMRLSGGGGSGVAGLIGVPGSSGAGIALPPPAGFR